MSNLTKPHPVSLWLNDIEKENLDKLRKQYSDISTSDALRLGLWMLCDQYLDTPPIHPKLIDLFRNIAKEVLLEAMDVK
jgi:hypothetical protein